MNHNLAAVTPHDIVVAAIIGAILGVIGFFIVGLISPYVEAWA